MNIGKNRKLTTDTDRQKIRQLDAEGHSRKEITERLDWSVGTVDRVLYRRRWADAPNAANLGSLSYGRRGTLRLPWGHPRPAASTSEDEDMIVSGFN